jgi:hypothetical protein
LVIDGDSMFVPGRWCGNDEETVPEVRGTKGCRWKSLPFRIEPEGGKVSEDSVKPKAKMPWDILQQCPLWS